MLFSRKLISKLTNDISFDTKANCELIRNLIMIQSNENITIF